MKTFLYRVLVFTILLLLVLVFSASIYGYLQHRFLESKNLRFDKSISTLIVGDSHAQTALDDKIIPHSKNVAFHAEHYLFTYFKLKKLLISNPQINRVILSYGMHNLSQGADVNIFSLGRNSRTFARYFMLLDDEGVKDVYSPSQNWRINYLKWRFKIPLQLKLEAKLLFKTLMNNKIIMNDFPFMGHFYASKKHIFNDVKEPIYGHFYKMGKLLTKSDLAIKYLYYLIDYCEENQVELVLMNTPLHIEYRKCIPNYYTKLYRETTNDIKDKYPNVTIIDYYKLALPNEYFGDYHHVNSKGSKIVSMKLVEDLKEK